MKNCLTKCVRTLTVFSLGLLFSQNSYGFLCLMKGSNGSCQTQGDWSQTSVSATDRAQLDQLIGKTSASGVVVSAFQIATMMPGPMAMANLGANFISANRSTSSEVKLKSLNNISGSLSNLCPPTRILASGATVQIALNSPDVAVATTARNNMVKALLFNLASPIPLHKMPPAVHLVQVGIITLLNAKINGQKLSSTEQEFLSRLESIKAKPNLSQSNELVQLAQSITGIRVGEDGEMLTQVQKIANELKEKTAIDDLKPLDQIINHSPVDGISAAQ